MSTADYMSEKDRRDLRDAGRGHLLGDVPSLAERADAERKRQREEGDGTPQEQGTEES